MPFQGSYLTLELHDLGLMVLVSLLHILRGHLGCVCNITSMCLNIRLLVVFLRAIVVLLMSSLLLILKHNLDILIILVFLLIELSCD